MKTATAIAALLACLATPAAALPPDGEDIVIRGQLDVPVERTVCDSLRGHPQLAPLYDAFCVRQTVPLCGLRDAASSISASLDPAARAILDALVAVVGDCLPPECVRRSLWLDVAIAPDEGAYVRSECAGYELSAPSRES